jgi:hypothetical protein
MKCTIFIIFFFTINIIGINAGGISLPPDSIINYYDNKHLRYENYIYKENIKTVLIHREGWELSYPIIKLKSDDKIRLSFDDLENQTRNYSYTLIHCNSNWQPSDITPSDYIDGFIENQFSGYKFSFNTLVKYIHYSITIPNNDIKLKISGNYIIKVYDNFDQEDLVLTARFCVEEGTIAINAQIKQPTIFDFRKSHQEVDFSLINNSKTIADPFSDIKVIISQNNRYDNEIRGLKPLFIKDNELVYNYDFENLFPGGSEFRHLDIKSMRFMSDRVKNINYTAPYYNVELFDDEPKPFKIYYFDNDLNGKFLIKVQEGNDSEVEADYVYVFFNLPYDAPIVKGNMYVLGEISDWNFSNTNKMVYNYEKKSYQLKMLLKQGYYNYEYVILYDDSKSADGSVIEGNHFETENDYLIFVYYKDIQSRYEKLAGVKIINSLTNR